MMNNKNKNTEKIASNNNKTTKNNNNKNNKTTKTTITTNNKTTKTTRSSLTSLFFSHLWGGASPPPPQPPFLQKPKIQLKNASNSKTPKAIISLFVCAFCPLSNIAFAKKMATTNFFWNYFKNRGFSKFLKLIFWGPKRWNYFLPVFKAPKNNVKIGVSFDLWLLPFPSLKKVVAKKTLSYRFFATPFFYNLVLTNIHQQPPEQKMESEKPVFGPKHQKATTPLHPLWNDFLTKIL